jgi:CheY-like chemotaxis protein
MTGHSEDPRVLVVDDSVDIRAAIRRVLTRSGYRVDEAGTLAEARALTPGGYDAVLIDMQLGSERGATLVEELTAADPGFARRCLALSGNPGSIPSQVAGLAKPFLPNQLVEAVRALRGPQSEAAVRPEANEVRNVPAPRTGHESEAKADRGPAQTLLGLSASLRERERAAFADALHAEPVQDLAVALMDLHLIRQQLPGDQQELLTPVTTQINQAAMCLRQLMREHSPRWLEEAPAETIGRQTAWLLAAPPDVNVHSSAEGMSQETARFVASVAELVLLTMAGSPESADHRPQARIGVSSATHGDMTHTVDLDITLGWAPGDPGPAAAAASESRRGSLLELACALGANIDLASDPHELRVRVSL